MFWVQSYFYSTIPNRLGKSVYVSVAKPSILWDQSCLTSSDTAGENGHVGLEKSKILSTIFKNGPWTIRLDSWEVY